MDAQGFAWPPDERVHYERTVATLADAMEPAERERFRAAGRAMTPREAVDFALGSRPASAR